eukprot:TRINITY_DN1642_c0_g4_i1.p1 TRINITY_DN1642_c0_g4~~TRINITY_DN1642_c0_g4_i1.p1  ORF type:complete len:735 (+),score=-14.88 TRINITY_DN1642_c0_g4_i1:402-2606(+)
MPPHVSQFHKNIWNQLDISTLSALLHHTRTVPVRRADGEIVPCHMNIQQNYEGYKDPMASYFVTLVPVDEEVLMSAGGQEKFPFDTSKLLSPGLVRLAAGTMAVEAQVTPTTGRLPSVETSPSSEPQSSTESSRRIKIIVSTPVAESNGSNGPERRASVDCVANVAVSPKTRTKQASHPTGDVSSQESDDSCADIDSILPVPEGPVQVPHLMPLSRSISHFSKSTSAIDRSTRPRSSFVIGEGNMTTEVDNTHVEPIQERFQIESHAVDGVTLRERCFSFPSQPTPSNASSMSRAWAMKQDATHSITSLRLLSGSTRTMRAILVIVLVSALGVGTPVVFRLFEYFGTLLGASRDLDFFLALCSLSVINLAYGPLWYTTLYGQTGFGTITLGFRQSLIGWIVLGTIVAVLNGEILVLHSILSRPSILHHVHFVAQVLISSLVASILIPWWVKRTTGLSISRDLHICTWVLACGVMIIYGGHWVPGDRRLTIVLLTFLRPVLLEVGALVLRVTTLDSLFHNRAAEVFIVSPFVMLILGLNRFYLVLAIAHTAEMTVLVCLVLESQHVILSATEDWRERIACRYFLKLSKEEIERRLSSLATAQYTLRLEIIRWLAGYFSIAVAFGFFLVLDIPLCHQEGSGSICANHKSRLNAATVGCLLLVQVALKLASGLLVSLVLRWRLQKRVKNLRFRAAVWDVLDFSFLCPRAVMRHIVYPIVLAASFLYIILGVFQRFRQ